MKPPITLEFDEAARLAALRRLGILDTAPEVGLDVVARLASRIGIVVREPILLLAMTTCPAGCAMAPPMQGSGIANFFAKLLDTADFPARWQCGRWSSGLGWLHVASDLAIFGAYLSIPLALIFFLVRRRDIPFPRLIALFGAFILSCGIGHALEALIFWHPVYRLSGLIKAITAVVSWASVVATIRILPAALKLPDIARLNQRLRRQVAERVSVERELRRSEAKARKLAMVASRTDNAVIITDADGRIEWVNDGFTRITEYHLDEVVGRAPGSFLQGPETDTATVDYMRAQLIKGEGFRVEILNYSKSGREYWLAADIQPLHDDDGSLIHFIAIESDITERKREDEARRKQAEEGLRESRMQLRTVVTAAPIILFALDRDGVFTLSEGRGLEALGRSPGESVGSSAFELYGSDPKIVADLRRALSGEAFHSVTEISGVTLEIRCTPLRDDEGALVGVIGIATDVSEHLRAEKALRHAEAKYRSIFENAVEGIFQTTPEGCYRSANPALARIFGFDSHEDLIAGITDIEGQLYLDPGRRDEFVRQMREHGSVSDFESQVQRRDGEVIWVSEHARAVLDGDGALLYYEGTVEDITARKRAEEERARLAMLVEASTDLIGMATPDGRAFFINEAGRRLVGLDAEAVRRTTIMDFFLPEDREFVREQVMPAVRERGRWEGDFRFRHFRTGHAIPVSWNLFLIRDPETEEPVAIATVTRDIAERKRAEHEIRSLNAHLECRLERIAALRRIDMAITSSLDSRIVLDTLLDQTVSQLGVHAAAILRLDPASLTLSHAAGRGFRSPAISRSRLHLGEGLAGRVATDGLPIYLTDLGSAGQTFVSSRLLEGEAFVSYFAVPLVAKGLVKGVLEVYHRDPLEPSPEWLDFLETLGGQAAIAIDNANLFEALQRSNTELTLAYDATIEGWSRALDLRDKETEGHTRRVTEMTLRLARAMGLGEAEMVHIRRGSLLHDIGKMGIPDAILLKPGPLTEDEVEIMRRHPQYAHEWLAPVPYLRPALEIPYAHHEKWDGTGYPRGLKGKQIPLSARIFAAVDIWDALRFDRPYRKGWPEERVRDHLRSVAGTHLDPEVVRGFLEILALEDVPPAVQCVECAPLPLGVAETDDSRDFSGPKHRPNSCDEFKDASIDLSGRKNSGQFREALEAAFSYAVRQGNPLSVAILEIDRFAEYNDAHGHADGEAVVCAVADLLRGEVRIYDMVARTADGEFAILLPATDLPAALAFAERLRSAIANHPWRHRPVTASLGLATITPDIFSGFELIVAANRALDRSKRAGRDCVSHARDLDNTPSPRLALSP